MGRSHASLVYTCCNNHAHSVSFGMEVVVTAHVPGHSDACTHTMSVVSSLGCCYRTTLLAALWQGRKSGLRCIRVKVVMHILSMVA